MRRILSQMHRGQKGITGLETAIILIAFVVVASVFAYTVLSAGLFSTQKSQEAVYSGLQETQSTLEPRGSVIAYKGDSNIASTVGKVEITVSGSVKEGQAIDLTPPYALAGGALVASGLQNPLQISYTDKNVTIASIPWTLSWSGKQNSDYNLDANEKAIITVWLHSYDGAAWAAGASGTFLAANNLSTDQQFTMELKPAKGAVLAIQRTTPASLDTVMDLH